MSETPQSFLTSCTKALHDKAGKLGFAKRGVIFIPELMQMGQQEVFYLLNDQFYISEFSSSTVLLRNHFPMHTGRNGFGS